MYKKVIGFPVQSPVSGFVAFVAMHSCKEEDCKKLVNCNVVNIFSPLTGYDILLGHVSDKGVIKGVDVPLKSIQNREYSAGELIGFIRPKDELSSSPHVHMEISKPSKLITTSMSTYERIDLYNEMLRSDNSFVDTIKLKFYIDETVLKDILIAPQC